MTTTDKKYSSFALPQPILIAEQGGVGVSKEQVCNAIDRIFGVFNNFDIDAEMNSLVNKDPHLMSGTEQELYISALVLMGDISLLFEYTTQDRSVSGLLPMITDGVLRKAIDHI